MDKADSQVEASMESNMQALVKAMRHMLANLKEEQKAIMLRNSLSMQKLLDDRHEILAEMRTLRTKLLNGLTALNHVEGHQDASDVILDTLVRQCGSENILILSLWDQILALSEAIDKQNNRNRLLLDCGKNLLSNPCPWIKPTPKLVIQTLENQIFSE